MSSCGPGTPCWCGCGEDIPDGKRSDARYVDDTHSTRFRRAEKELAASRSTPDVAGPDYWAKHRAAKKDRGGVLGYDPALLVLMETDSHRQRLGCRAKKARRESYEEIGRTARKEANGEELQPQQRFTRWRHSDQPRPTPAVLAARGRRLRLVGQQPTVVALLPKVTPHPWHFARVPAPAGREMAVAA
jgi:hypothetical protein